MNSRVKFIICVLAAFLLFTPVTFYYVVFKEHPISTDTEKWGQFGDYLNGTFMPLIALIGVIATLLLGLISESRNKAITKIEQQKQRPLLHIGYFDGEAKIRLFMKNKGNGPLIIYKYKLINLLNNEELEGIYDCLPLLDRDYDNYTGSQISTVLSPIEEQELLLLEQGEEDDDEDFEEAKTKLRQALAQYKIMVEYKDVYDNEMPTYERSLAWFGRHEIS